MSAQEFSGVTKSDQRAQECSAWHTDPLSRSLVPWKTVMVMKTNFDYISFSSSSAENILSNVPVVALGNDIVQFKTDL